MTAPLPLTRPLSNVGRLYRMYRADRLSEAAYFECLGFDTCATPCCPWLATETIDAKHYCDVCAVQARALRASAIGLPFDDSGEVR